MHTSWITPLVCSLSLLMAPSLALTQECEVAKLVPAPAGPTPTGLGGSVAVDGDRAIVGAPSVESCGPGMAVVFRHDGVGWIEEQTLTLPDGAENEAFGLAVSLSGDVAVVGASGDDELGPDAGAVHVYRRDPGTGIWQIEQKLTAFDGDGGDTFGISVSSSGDTIVVGASNDDDLGLSSGSVYVFVTSAPRGSSSRRSPRSTAVLRTCSGLPCL